MIIAISVDGCTDFIKWLIIGYSVDGCSTHKWVLSHNTHTGRARTLTHRQTDRHTHTHYIYIYIYILQTQHTHTRRQNITLHTHTHTHTHILTRTHSYRKKTKKPPFLSHIPTRDTRRNYPTPTPRPDPSTRPHDTRARAARLQATTELAGIHSTSPVPPSPLYQWTLLVTPLTV